MKTLDGTDILWTAAEAAAATNGRHPRARTAGHWLATGVCIDPGAVRPGDLFIALKTPSCDGHAHVAEAIAKGAAAAIVSAVPAGMGAEAPLLLVDDTLAALEDLARVARVNARGRVIAITGSVGKTGSREALKLALTPQGRTMAGPGSGPDGEYAYWSVPLGLARLPADARFGLMEIGLSRPGDMAALSRMAKPDVAVVTAVEAVHLDRFPSVEAIADAFAGIFEGMDPNGTAILNRDNAHYGRLLAAARTCGLTRVWSFGAAEGADARLLDCSIHATSSAVTAQIRGERLQYCLSLPGRHHVMNSLAVLLAVHAAGGDMGIAARQLSQLQPIRGRGLRRRIALPGHGRPGASVTLIDEARNACPVSVTAAATVLGKTDPAPGGRRILVLGDMQGLGLASASLHAGLAGTVRASGADLVFTCGPMMKHLFDRLPASLRGRHGEDSAALAPLVSAAVRPGDVVMVKGSAGSHMSCVVDALLALDQAVLAPALAVTGS